MKSRSSLVIAVATIVGVSVVLSHAYQEVQPLRFGVSASVESTDNRDATATDEQSNVDAYLRPYVEYNADTGVTVTTFRYQPGLRYRSDPGDDQNEMDLQHLLELRLRQSLSDRSRFRLSNTFQSIEDPQIEEGGAIQRSDRSYILNTARAALNYDVGQLSNLDFAFLSQIRSYDEDVVAAQSDKDQIGGGVTYRVTLSPLLRGLVNADYAAYGYESTGGRARDFDSMTGSLGVEYVFTPQFVGSFSGGMQSRSYDDSALDNESNGYAKGELSGTLNPDLVVGVMAGMGVRDADVFPYPSQEYTEFRGFADASLSAAVSLRFALTYRQSTYDAYSQLSLAGGDEDTMVGDIQLTYKLTDMASLMAGHRFEDVSSDQTLRSSDNDGFTKNTSRVGMRWDF